MIMMLMMTIWMASIWKMEEGIMEKDLLCEHHGRDLYVVVHASPLSFKQPATAIRSERVA
jgi:hypothetical protein